MTSDLSVLERELGHVFRDRELLERALTHKSRVHEVSGKDLPGKDVSVSGKDAPGRDAPGNGSGGDNEQLEFLGDAILGFVVSECLVRRHGSFPEGRLSKLKAHLVSAAHLHEVAQRLNLGEYLYLGRGEELSGGREKKALLSDAAEALIAALYLDAGMEAARAFIEARVVGALEIPADGAPAEVNDHKSALQEMAQTLKLPPPRYVIVSQEGPEHSKTFTVEVRLGKAWTSQGQGLSKKAAGQKAAQQILQQLVDLAT